LISKKICDTKNRAGLKRGVRQALLRNLAANFISREKITTTEGRAKELKSYVEKLITLGRRQDLPALRLLLQRLPQKAAYKLYYEISPRYLQKHGGYTRVTKLTKRRLHDGSKMATLELV